MAGNHRVSSRSREARGTTIDHAVERLSQRFAQFHRQHPKRTRIPDALRRAALAALERGASQTQLRRACGVSASQLRRWQLTRPVFAKDSAPTETATARVFSVVGGDAEPTVGPGHSQPDDELELRLGGWSISVRRVEQ